MSDLSDELVAISLELLEEYGSTAQFLPGTSGTYNTATGTRTNSEGSVDIKVLPEDDKGTYGNKDGVQIGDKKFTCAAAAFPREPTVKDRLGFGGKKYDIKNFDTYSLNDVPVLYVIYGSR